MNICLQCTKCTDENKCIWVRTLKITPPGTQYDNKGNITYCPDYEFDTIFKKLTREEIEQIKQEMKRKERINTLKKKLDTYLELYINQTNYNQTLNRNISYTKTKLMELLPPSEQIEIMKQIKKVFAKCRAKRKNKQ